MEIVQPIIAEQPSRLRATLLPFQKESLYWMRKQEFGPYAGGLLAVSILQRVVMFSSDGAYRTKWGMWTRTANIAAFDLAYSMGKTIQMIALMVSDESRPNLVIACVEI
jgi:DNA repair protein RAD16